MGITCKMTEMKGTMKKLVNVQENSKAQRTKTKKKKEDKEKK